jgi:hypothetical protein
VVDDFTREALAVIATDGKVNLGQIHAPTGEIFGGIDLYPLHIKPSKLTAQIIRVELTERNCLHLDQVEIFGHQK